MTVRTRLKDIRTKRGVKAADLARLVGVSRQTIYAIEYGNFVPNTAVALLLSRALNASVEDIFSIADEPRPETIEAEILGENPIAQGQVVKLCRVHEKVIGVPVSGVPAFMPSGDAIVESFSRSRVYVKAPLGVPEAGKRLLIAGCDPALSLIQEELRSSGIAIITVPCASRRALEWLKKGLLHAAGCHLLDRTTGEYNVPIIRRVLAERSVRVVTFAAWQQGFVVRHANPKRIRSIADLVAGRATIINREAGSGSRDLLDSGLRELGIPKERVHGYQSIAYGHLAAAHAVATGTADCCIAPASAARCFGLDFVPLALQRFDLAFSSDTFELPGAKALVNELNRSHLRIKLQSIAGYDTAQTGQILI